jgi:hypothetical protein
MAKHNKGGMHPTRIFKTPEELEAAWQLFKENLKEQSKEWVKVQYVGKDGERVAEPQKLPLTMEGFEVYCYNNIGCVNQYFDNKDGLYDDFVTITTHIRKEIRENQIIGGMVGFFHPNITARLNNLVEKQEVENTGDGTFNVIVHKTPKAEK